MIISRSNVGSETIVSGMVNILEDRTVIPNVGLTTNFISQELACDQLPHLSFYISAPAGTAIAPSVFMLPQYAIRLTDGGGAQQFMDLPGSLLPPTNDILLTFDVPANYIRMRFAIGPDPAGVQIRLLIVCQASAT